MNLEFVPRLLTATTGFYLLLYGPGQAWWNGTASALPRPFARMACSVAWSSAAGVILASLGLFSVPGLILINALVCFAGYLLVGRRREEGLRRHVRAGAGAFIAAAALWATWPPMQTHISGSDSSAYLAAGVHLARNGSLSRHDPLIAKMTEQERFAFLPSALGYPWKPPFSRIPGGMVVELRTDDTAHASFFPLPSVWAAVFADLLGPWNAGGYAPMFSALALWALWIIVRRRVGPVASLLCIAIAALNAASYWSARFPLAEPPAAFFAWSAIAALDVYEEEGFRADAFATGLLAAALPLARAEYLLFAAVALALRPLVGPAVSPRRLGLAFALGAVFPVAAFMAQVSAIEGAYLTPLFDTAEGLHYRFSNAARAAPWKALSVGGAGLITACWCWWRWGLRGVASASAVALLGVYTLYASHGYFGRSLHWIHAYFGPLLPAAALLGLVCVWRDRHQNGATGLIVIFAVVTGWFILYDPHVVPVMPWATRRFVPFLIPAAALLAAILVGRIGERSRVAAVVAGATIAWTSLVAAQPLYERNFYTDGWRQLSEVATALPRDGIVILDSSLNVHVLGTPLWLVHDINNLTLDTRLQSNRVLLGGFVGRHRQTPVYLVSPISAFAPQRQIDGTLRRRITETTLQIRLPEQTETGVPKRAVEHTVTLGVDLLIPIQPGGS